MVMTDTRPQSAAASRYARFWADFAYVLPGFFISTFAFVLLVTMFAVSVSTLIIWVGAILLPLTLFIGSGFAELSRRRLALWGMPVSPPQYFPKGPGLRGYWRWVADPRRWLDLVFETLVAFPLRVATFCVALTWIAGALAGVTWWSWAFYIPDSEPRLPGRILEAITDGAAPDGLTRSFAFESACYFVIGVVFLVTLPLVMRGLATLDAAVTAAALAGSGDAGHRRGEDSPAGQPAQAGQEGFRGVGAVMREALLSRAARPTSGPSLSGEGWAWIAVSFAAALALAIVWPLLATLHGVHVALAMVIAVAEAAGLVLLVRWVWAGIGLNAIAVAGAVLLAVPDAAPWPWPVPMLIGQALLVLVVALRHPWQVAFAAWALPQLVPIVASFWTGRFPTENLIVCLGVSAAVGAAAVAIRILLRGRRALRDARRQGEELSAERTELAERNRIAQELHDVVAHSMSVISVQATTAKYRLDDVDDDTADEFASIAESSRKALAEMRGLLAVLRAPGGEAPLAPQPGADDIAELVEASRRSGARIEVESRGELSAMPSATGLTAYRIVQEALSNAVRHAPGADIRVEVIADDGELVVRIANGPRDAALGTPRAPGAGLGLQGIRDRVAALGGTVAAGPSPDGGFHLRAALPLG